MSVKLISVAQFTYDEAERTSSAPDQTIEGPTKIREYGGTMISVPGRKEGGTVVLTNKNLVLIFGNPPRQVIPLMTITGVESDHDNLVLKSADAELVTFGIYEKPTQEAWIEAINDAISSARQRGESAQDELSADVTTPSPSQSSADGRAAPVTNFRMWRTVMLILFGLLWICLIILLVSIGSPFTGALYDLPGVAILGLVILLPTTIGISVHLRRLRSRLRGPLLIPDSAQLAGQGVDLADLEFQREETQASSLPLIGIVHAVQLSYQNHRGYGLAVTPERVVGARLSVWTGLIAYLGPGSKADDGLREKASAALTDIEAKKEVELMKDDIIKVSWKEEGFFDSGHFLFNTNKGDFEFVTAGRNKNLGVIQVDRTLLSSLLLLAPDRFYNEKTGALIADEAKARYAKKLGSGMSSS